MRSRLNSLSSLSLTASLLLLQSMLLIGTEAVAQPTVYEGWDLGLGNGASAVGFGGSTSIGFDAGGWTFSNGVASATFDLNGLAYTDSEGNELNIAGGAVTISPSDGEPRWGRSLDVGITDRPSEFFVSYLLRLDSAATGDAFWTTDGSWDKAAAGLQSSPNLRFVNGQVTGINAEQGETNLLVIRISRDDDDGSAADGDQDQAELWINPVLNNPGDPDALFNTGGNPNDSIRNGTSVLFKFNTVNQGAYTIDEFRIGDSFADVVPFVGLPSLGVEVDVNFGEIKLFNESSTTYQVVGYQIKSDGRTLNEAGFLPLQLQARSDFPGGDGSGNGWEVVGTPDDGFLSEQYLSDSSTLAPGVQLTLGASYNALADLRDLEVELLLEDGSILPVTNISYLDDGSSIPGDYNQDQTVDSGDFVVWRDGVGTLVQEPGLGADGNFNGLIDQADYLVWRRHFGQTTSTDIALAEGVPEPSSAFVFAALLFCPPIAQAISRTTRNSLGGRS